MSCGYRAVAVAAALAMLLALPGAFVARADVGADPVTLGGRFLLNARLWGMGGGMSVVPQGADGLLANPAGAVLAGTPEVVIDITEADLTASLSTPQSADPADLHVPEPTATPAALSEDSGHGPQPWEPASVGGQRLLPQDGSRFAFAQRPAPGSPWAWGMSAEAYPSMNARLLDFGVALRGANGFSLGLNWKDMLVEGSAVDVAVLGAAYERGRWTIAVDRVKSAGDVLTSPGTLLGAEYQLDNRIALRMGSAAGALTYGIGYQKDRWAVDLARLTAGPRETVLPVTMSGIVGDAVMFSISCTY